jgi:hypothetical protein
MSARRRLENRRSSLSFSFSVGGLRYSATFSRFDNGDLAEVFLNSHRANSAADVSARDAAVLVSLCLQHGVELATIKRALMRNADGTGSGPVACALDIIVGKEPR